MGKLTDAADGSARIDAARPASTRVAVGAASAQAVSARFRAPARMSATLIGAALVVAADLTTGKALAGTT